jgi:hypothetical protein
MAADQWYAFLHDKYFKWKYTGCNRYATTTRHLEEYKASGELDRGDDIRAGLQTAQEIRGLGMAGASGLLALMYPDFFGTVGQFDSRTRRRRCCRRASVR